MWLLSPSIVFVSVFCPFVSRLFEKLSMNFHEIFGSDTFWDKKSLTIDCATLCTSCTTSNKTIITMLSCFVSFSFTHSRKSAGNKSATNPPQKYSASRISAEKDSAGGLISDLLAIWKPSYSPTAVKGPRHVFWKKRFSLILSSAPIQCGMWY